MRHWLTKKLRNTPLPNGTDSAAPAKARLALASIALGASVAPLDSAVNVAFPTITADFHQPVSAIRWVIIVYVLVYASLPLAFGRIADLFGHRKVFLTGLTWCVVSMSLCAAATEFHWLLTARVFQGVGTTLILASAPALVTLTLPPEQRTRGIAVYTFAFALAATAGPLLGGVLVQWFGWPSVFWMRIPVALAAIVLTLRHVPAPAPTPTGHGFDYLAGGTLGFGLAATLLAVGQGGSFGWTSPLTLTLAVAGMALLVAFVRRQSAPRYRVIDLALFRDPRFATVNLCHVLLNGAYFMIMLLVPFYLARVHGSTGVILLALAPLGFAVGSPLAERALRRFGARAVSISALALCAVFLSAIGLWTPETPIIWVAVGLLVSGMGYGLFQVAAMDQVMGTLSRAHQGVAGSLNTVTRTIGVVLGASAGAAAFDASSMSSGFMAGFSVVLLGAGCVSALATASMVTMGAFEKSAPRS